MAYTKGHMFYILFNTVLLTSAVTVAQKPSDVNVSGNVGVFVVLPGTVGFNTDLR